MNKQKSKQKNSPSPGSGRGKVAQSNKIAYSSGSKGVVRIGVQSRKSSKKEKLKPFDGSFYYHEYQQESEEISNFRDFYKD